MTGYSWISNIPVVLLTSAFLMLLCSNVSMTTNEDMPSSHKTDRPSKMDLGIILDASERMPNREFQTSMNVLSDLTDYLSISPGTTRVAFYTVTNKTKMNFTFKKHVNRECLLNSLKMIVMPKTPVTTSRNQTILQENIRKVFRVLIEKNKEVDEQLHVYLFMTNNRELPKLFKSYNGLELKTGSHVIFLVTKRRPPPGLRKQTISNQEFEPVKKNQDSDSSDFNNQKTIFTEVEINNKAIGAILEALKLPVKSRVLCHVQNGSPAIDECERHCTCKDGKMTDCYRVRKEFTSMTSEERRRYLLTYKTLTSTTPYKEIYEKFIFMHYKYFCWGIHSRDLFLPWHRWYLTIMEDLLRQIDCRVTIPYWDWSHVSEDPWNRTNLWRATDDGLGSNGNQYKGYCVEKGIFRESEWTTPYWEDPMDIILSATDQIRGNIEDQRSHLAFCLRRAFKGHSPSAQSVKRTLELPAKKFKDFDIQMRHNFHDRIHNIIGGTMCTHYAGDTPEFFLHHSFLDKIWYKWQQKSDKHKWVHFRGRNSSKMMGSDYTQYELTDSHQLPRCMKVKYEDFPIKSQGKRSIDLSDEVDSMARRPTKYWQEYLSESWEGTFPNCSRSKKEKKRAKYLHGILDGP